MLIYFFSFNVEKIHPHYKIFIQSLNISSTQIKNQSTSKKKLQHCEFHLSAIFLISLDLSGFLRLRFTNYI